MRCVTPNDKNIIGKSDSESIQNAIDYAIEQNINTVIIPKLSERTGLTEWVIEKSILLPSDITIILDNCHLTLADGVYENIFRNKNICFESRSYLGEEQSHIQILGRGNAVLDGGNNENGLHEQTYQKMGIPMQTSHLIFLCNVVDYVIEGIKCVNMRYWAINQIGCKRGRLSDITFYNGAHVPNQDGINLRIGCSEILIERIKGRTGDDSVALSAFPAEFDGAYLCKDRNCDIHDVTIRDVCTRTAATVVALRCSDGAKLYNIRIDNISTSEEIYPDNQEYGPWGVVRIGENNYYRNRPAIHGEIFNITVTNVRSLFRGTVYLAATLKDSVIRDVYAEGKSMYAISTYQSSGVFWENGCVVSGGASLENVLLENIHFNGTADYRMEKFINDPDENYIGCGLDFRCMRESDFLKNVIVRDVFVKEGVPIKLMREGLELNIQ
ncbi:MAG: hypothetical protein IJE10_01405 [Clostridia bacterium]|nr:hypothetical protein [Clostridia bacterium]